MKPTLLLTLLLPLAASAEAERPNILLVMADDLGFSDLGCYGGEIATPHLDRLAENGLRFTHFYNTGRCWPTRAALLTGFHAQQVRRDALPGVKGAGGGGKRPAWAPLLPALLEPLGYRSHHSGKWHLDGTPLGTGFDRSYHLADQHRFFTPKSHTLDGEKLPSPGPADDFYGTTAIADRSIAFLREHAADFPDRPFFHYLAFTAPHFPLHALPEDIAIYRERYRVGWEAIRTERAERLRELGIHDGEPSAIERQLGPPYDFPDDLEALGPNEVNRPLPWDSLTPEQQRFQADKMAVHAAMVHRMDLALGRVLARIEAMGALDDTLILFLSDNGASAEIMVRGDGHDRDAAPGSADSHLCLGPGWSSASNTPFRRHKVWTHEGGIATPLIVHWPQGIAARGELRDTPGHVIDVVPTLLELAGSEHPREWRDKPVPTPPGRSLAPFFKADDAAPHEHLWWFHEGHRAVRVGDWKLVAAKGDPWELYDLADDRTEQHDLANDHPERVSKLKAAWQRQLDHAIDLATRE